MASERSSLPICERFNRNFPPNRWPGAKIATPFLDGRRVRQGAAAWLHVTYCVDEQARVVFVTKVRLMPNTPLADAP